MNEEKMLREYIRGLEHIISYFRSILDAENKNPAPPEDKLLELTNLRMLAKSDVWPEAVPPDLLCGEDEDSKLARASGIVQEFIKTDVSKKRFLDFGCGEGHVPYVVASIFDAEFSTGYDVKEQNWSNLDKNREMKNLLLTNQWEDALEKGPYDVILVNDVIDHSADPLKALNQIRLAKRPEIGKVYMRCHPWTSRHGTHLYKTLNRAYLHLVFTPDELYAMGLKEMATQPALAPLSFYRHLFRETGFTVVKEETVTQPVELFFTRNPALLRRIKEKWRTSTNEELATGVRFPREIMEIQFVDYMLI